MKHVDEAPQSSTYGLAYELGDVASRGRARSTAVLGTLAALGPVALVVVLLQKLGYAAHPWAIASIAGLGALAIVRGLASYARVGRRLRAFRVAIEGDELAVRTASAELRVKRDAIVRVTEIEGALGGLRVLLRDEGDDAIPERIDIPRGGASYGELRARLGVWRPIERTPRRGFIARVAVGAAVVAGIFFLPFVFEDFVVRSKGVAIALVLGLWLAARFMTRR